MCLGAPGQILEIRGSIAIVDFWGVEREVRLDILKDPIELGDFILNHEGYAVRRIPDEEIYDTLALYEVLLTEAGADPVATECGCGCPVDEDLVAK